MSQIVIGPYRYTVLKQDGDRVLVSWIDSITGIHKQLWINIKKYNKENVLYV